MDGSTNVHGGGASKPEEKDSSEQARSGACACFYREGCEAAECGKLCSGECALSALHHGQNDERRAGL